MVTGPLVMLLALGVGCGWIDGRDNVVEARQERIRPERPPKPPSEAQPLEVPGVERIARRVEISGPTIAELPKEDPALVVLVIMDTVGSSHLHACGYARPTSPVLETMDRLGGVLTCDAYSPGTWTLPTHASYFSGLPVHEHDLHRKGLSLGEEVTTLAEVFERRGYQTLLISANPVLKKGTGLHQGFHRTIVAHGLDSPLRGPGMTRMLKSELTLTDKARPLFLVLNVFDAHDPYPPIPAGMPWVPERTSLVINKRLKTSENPYFRFIQGEMSDEERAAWLAHATDTYDYGVAIADRSVGRMLKLLERGGWIDHGARVVITSDHGENLGDHGLMGHDGPPWESVTRVPFLFIDTTRETPMALPEPFAATNLFALLSTGRMPKQPIPVQSSSIRYGNPDRRYVDALARWYEGDDKLMWMSGREARFDLEADPQESTPLPVTDHPKLGEVREAVERHMASKARALEKETDPEVTEMLEAVGYTD